MKVANIAPNTYKNLPWIAVDTVALTNQTTTAMNGTVISGVTVSSTTRVLLTNQTSAIENGLYLNNERSPQMPTGDNSNNLCFFDINTKEFWYNSTNSIIGTDSMTITKFGLNNLGDVVIATPSLNQSLVYNGTNWANTSTTSAPTSYCAPTGELSFVGTYTLNMSNNTLWYKLNPTTSFASNNVNYSTAPWASPSQARLQWVYPASGKYFHSAHSFAVSINQNGAFIEFSVYQNGVQIPNSVVLQTFRNSSDRQMFSFHVVANANQNDYFEIYASSSVNSTTMTVYNYNMVFMACCSYYT